MKGKRAETPTAPVNDKLTKSPFLPVIAIVLFALFAVVAAGGLYHGNGRPGCQTDEEMNTRDWRNTWDPVAFWRCQTRNVDAVRIRCEEEHERPMGFMTGRGCVEWSAWDWVEPVAPPSPASSSQ